MKYPVFNFKPLDDLVNYLEFHGSDRAKELMKEMIGDPDCCWGNPCYHLACLACYCRGNLKYLTADQAKTREGRTLAKDQVEFENRKALISLETKAVWEQQYEDDVLDLSEHLSDSGAWLD